MPSPLSAQPEKPSTAIEIAAIIKIFFMMNSFVFKPESFLLLYFNHDEMYVTKVTVSVLLTEEETLKEVIPDGIVFRHFINDAAFERC